MEFHINPACWHHYPPEALGELIESHPLLFPENRRPGGGDEPQYEPIQRKDSPYTDPWGCLWVTSDDGISGLVRGHPLESWDDYAALSAPDPERTDGLYPIDWAEIERQVRRAKGRGELVSGSLPHGFAFLRLQDLRGYENLMADMADGHPNLQRLVDRVSDFNAEIVRRWIELEPDLFYFPEDLGMQSGPMISPPHFRRYIMPVYQRLMAPARDNGIAVHMHCDGDIRTLAKDLVQCGVEVLNLQDQINGIDWISRNLAGKICIDLDIDRQSVTPHGTPLRIDALIREEVEKLGRREGGLMMSYGLYPGVPLENIKALMDAMETYAFYHSG